MGHGPCRPARRCAIAGRRAYGRRGGQCPACAVHHHRVGGVQPRGPVSISDVAAARRPLRGDDTRSGLRVARCPVGPGERGARSNGRLGTPARAGYFGADDQCRVDGQHARVGSRKAVVADLRDLSHPGARRQVQVQQPGVPHRRAATDAKLCESKHAGCTANAQRCAPDGRAGRGPGQHLP